MPCKCDNCGSFKVEGVGPTTHLFKQKDGSYSHNRTNKSTEDIITYPTQCKVCGQKFIRKMKPFPLINGKYVVE
jgi:hypothetical protein